MFDKEESKKYVKGNLNKGCLFSKLGPAFITMTLITSITTDVLASSNQESEFLKSHFIQEQQKFDYAKMVLEYQDRKYNDKIVSLYNDGLLQIDEKIYPLRDFFIKYNLKDNQVDLHLICVGSGYSDILTGATDEYVYNGATKFMNTDAFINLINSDAVVIENNKIIIIDKEKALGIIANWNGMLHSLVKETDAILNKNVFSRGDGNGKTR